MQGVHTSVYRPRHFIDSTGYESNLQRTVLCIDSRDRTLPKMSTSATLTAPSITTMLSANPSSLVSYPRPNSYKVMFPTYFRVRRVRLLTTEMPNAQFPVRVGNNNIDWTDGTGTHTAPIIPGAYTGTSLATAVATAMNLALGSPPAPPTYSATYNVDTGKITITAAAVFTLLVQTGPSTLAGTAAWSIIGFDAFPVANVVAVPVAGNFDATSFSVVKLNGESYIYMRVKTLQTMRTSDACDGSNVFAKIVLDVPVGFMSFSNFVSNDLEWLNAKDVLRELDIDFVNHDGTPYDFQNVDHSFTLELLHQRA